MGLLEMTESIILSGKTKKRSGRNNYENVGLITTDCEK